MDINYEENKIKFEAFKNEILEIYSISNFDVSWIENEVSKVEFDPENPFEKLVIFQNKLIRIIALRLKNEKLNRYKTEKQFQIMMDRYTAQI